MWLFGAMIFVLGAGMGLVMQTIVLAVQNSVDPHEIGTATSTNNFFREIGAAVGTALFSTMFTTKLAENLAGSSPGRRRVRGGEASSLTPAAVQALPEPLKTGVIDAFTNALAPSFWYLVPVIAVGFVLAAVPARGQAVRRGRHGRPRRGPRGRRVRAPPRETVDGAVVVDDLSGRQELPTQRDERRTTTSTPAPAGNLRR